MTAVTKRVYTESEISDIISKCTPDKLPGNSVYNILHQLVLRGYIPVSSSMYYSYKCMRSDVVTAIAPQPFKAMVDVLKSSFAKTMTEIANGTCVVGPHRADVISDLATTDRNSNTAAST